jgi:hypothetical protein
MNAFSLPRNLVKTAKPQLRRDAPIGHDVNIVSSRPVTFLMAFRPGSSCEDKSIRDVREPKLRTHSIKNRLSYLYGPSTEVENPKLVSTTHTTINRQHCCCRCESCPSACPPPNESAVASDTPNWVLRIEAELQGITPLISP